MPRTPRTTDGTKAPAKPKRPSPAKKPGGISDKDVAKRAHEIYEARGGHHGADMDDWLEAEKQLRAARTKPKKKDAG
jgi:hypothetical protein